MSLGWVFGIIGTLGIGGFVALAFFAPLAAQAVIKIALAALQRILATRIGCAALAGAACLVAGALYGDHQGAARIQDKWDDAKVEYAEALETMRDAASEQARKHNENARERENEAAASEAKRIDTYAQTLPRSAADDCRITDADLAGAQRVRVEDRQRKRPVRRDRDPDRLQR